MYLRLSFNKTHTHTLQRGRIVSITLYSVYEAKRERRTHFIVVRLNSTIYRPICAHFLVRNKILEEGAFYANYYVWIIGFFLPFTSSPYSLILWGFCSDFQTNFKFRLTMCNWQQSHCIESNINNCAAATQLSMKLIYILIKRKARWKGNNGSELGSRQPRRYFMTIQMRRKPMSREPIPCVS